MTQFGDAFLVHPDLFPARTSGETAGNRNLGLRLAGQVYRFSGLSVEQQAALGGGRMSRYVVDCVPGVDVEIAVFAAPASDFVDLLRCGETYRADIDGNADRIRIAAMNFMGKIELRPVFRGAIWTPIVAADDFSRVVENFLRPLVAYQALLRDGLVLHSAAVEAGGARLFLGPSGIGKSTIAALARQRGLPTLNDDMNLVRFEPDGLTVEPMPFTGLAEPQSDRRVPLRGIYLLHQGTTVRIDSLSAAEAFVGVVACSPYVNRDSICWPTLAARAEQLASQVPIRSLTFPLDAVVWDTLLEEGH